MPLFSHRHGIPKFRNIRGSDTINLAVNKSNEIIVSSREKIENLGYGHGIFHQKVKNISFLKSIVAGSGISITDTNTSIIINSTITGGDSEEGTVQFDLPWTIVEATGDGVVDDYPAIMAAVESGAPVILPPVPVHYRISQPLVLPAGTTIIGLDNPTIAYYGTTTGQRGMVETGGEGITLEGFTLDARRRTAGNSGWFTTLKVTHNNTKLRDMYTKDSGWRGTYRLNVSYCEWIGGSSRFHSGPGLSLWGVSHSRFENLNLSDNANFGVHMEDGTHHCHLEGLRAHNIGNNFISLELIGMVFSCYNNKIVNCVAEGTGDNGISVSGYRNIVNGNHCVGNTYSGIDVYGSENVVTGNYCANNNQRRSPSHPRYDVTTSHYGIGLKAFWGGLASRNTIVGNVCIDYQTSPTQYIGIYINPSAYPLWASNTAYTYLSYVYYGTNVYKARITGSTDATSGTTPPTHTSGTVTPSGENLGWEYVATFEGNAAPKHNNLSGNVATGNIARQVFDGTNNANFLADEGLIQLKGPATYNYRTTIETFTGHAEAAGRTGRIGSMHLRLNGGVGQNIYTKEKGDLQAGDWVPVQTRRSGTTAQRPTPASDALGYMYWDTSLNKPVYWKGNGWVDSDGANA